jgi:2'-5' RNA ligase
MSIHMTLRFLGEISDEEAAAAASALDAVCASGCAGFFSLATLGVFPKARNPGVLWAGPDHPPEGLLNLAKSLERGLKTVGFPNKQGFFRPHLTLARRRRSARPLEGVNEALKEAEKKWLAHPLPIQPTEAVLFRSELLPGGAVYQAVHRAPFLN